jgi:hypothetical protein
LNFVLTDYQIPNSPHYSLLIFSVHIQKIGLVQDSVLARGVGFGDFFLIFKEREFPLM